MMCPRSSICSENITVYLLAREFVAGLVLIWSTHRRLSGCLNLAQESGFSTRPLTKRPGGCVTNQVQSQQMARPIRPDSQTARNPAVSQNTPRRYSVDKSAIKR